MFEMVKGDDMLTIRGICAARWLRDISQQTPLKLTIQLPVIVLLPWQHSCMHDCHDHKETGS